MSWFFNKRRNSQRPKHYNRTRLGVEQLEGRDLCAADIDHNGAAIVIDASDEQWGVQTTVTYLSGDANDPYDDKVRVDVKYSNGSKDTKTFDVWTLENHGDHVELVRNVSIIYFYGSEKGDVFKNNTGLDSVARGGGGNDTLMGGSASDQFFGGYGDDKLYGNDGWDYLYAHEGYGNDAGAVDYLFGGKDADSLYGGAYQSNYMYGEGGNDRLMGGDGPGALNMMYGDVGIDWLFGGDNGATNHMFGGAGNDFMTGGSSEFGKPKTMNIMTDDEGADLFLGGSRALNYMFAGDGSGYAWQKDTIVPGEFNSYDYWTADNNDLIWNPIWGVYPNKPK